MWPTNEKIKYKSSDPKSMVYKPNNRATLNEQIEFWEMETLTSMFFDDGIICGLIEWNTKATQTWGAKR